MKTSYKLFLGFTGLLVLMMLIANIVVWANFKNGYSGKGPIQTAVNAANRTMKLPAFKVLKLEGIDEHHFPVIKSDSNEIVFSEAIDSSFVYSIQNDTLFLNLGDYNLSTLRCTQLNSVIVAKGSVFLQEFNQPLLDVSIGKGCTAMLQQVQFGRLTVAGGEESTLRIYENMTKVDSLTANLGTNSIFESENVPYKYLELDIDKLKELNMTGASLSSMKQIR
ncbi:hypothetical protein [Chitinophaga rhizophila]|uniref:Auto-transporter adhesin head GIN domain-containing protein n=1 Tax=Chitinophaga rhizophila TaxID=2866212 RepID=A0ABS7GK72_9BACT|nr:hypothetical protein [Chitinophaga rhizophila]MBW8688119.1 hypothetical protein [Chitinophaga rhizophila]